MRKYLIPLVVAATALLTLPSVATAGPLPDESDLDVDLVSYVEPLRFALSINDEAVECDAATFEVTMVELLSYPSSVVVGTATPVSVTEDPTDPNRATLVLPSDTLPGGLRITVTCSDGEEFEAIGEILFASIPVTKVVTGVAPTDATFVVHVDCDDTEDDDVGGEGYGGIGTQELSDIFAVDLTFGVSGGTKYVYTDGGTDCIVTETQTSGATSVDISPPLVSTDPAPAAYPVTVTNTFAAEIQPNFTG